MNEQTGSKTAFGAATLRAAHQLLDGDAKLLDDPVILSLLGSETHDYIVNNKERFFQPYAVAMRTSIVLRSRYAEDRLKMACENEVRQYLVLGAGLDTFAYRQPGWARDLNIVEADHPASQKTKSKLLYRAHIAVPENVVYTQVNMESDDLTSICSAVIDLAKPVFISCLGVLVYLNRHTCEKIFRFAGSLARGSEFVFTVRQNSDDNIIAQKAAEAGEPWISHFTKAELCELLKNCGFSNVHFLTVEEINGLYADANIIRSFPLHKSSVVKASV